MQVLCALAVSFSCSKNDSCPLAKHWEFRPRTGVDESEAGRMMLNDGGLPTLGHPRLQKTPELKRSYSVS